MNQKRLDVFYYNTMLATKILNLRLDTGAGITVVLDHYLRKNTPLIQPTNKRLLEPGHQEV